MSIPSWLESEFLTCNDVIKDFDVESVLSYSPFPSAQPIEDPPTYTTHHDTICNFVDNCNSGCVAGCSPYSKPILTATFCNSGGSNDGRSRTIPTEKRKQKLIEKQRRKDMNALLSVLKSLLPDENLRGKRSAADQVQESVNYIHHLQRKVEDLQREREKMKVDSGKNPNLSVQGLRFSGNEKFRIKAPAIGESDQGFPSINIIPMGSAVQVRTNTFDHQLLYSDLLMALEDGGLEVVSASSSTISDRVYHTIHAKVSDLNIFNVDTVYLKLWHLIGIRTNHKQERDSQTVDAQA
eukprot:PITA_29112